MKLYTKTVCPKCMLVKTLLNEAGVNYEIVNIDFDNIAYEKIKEQGFLAVPIAEVDDKFYADIKDIQALIPVLLERQETQEQQNQ